VRPPPLSAPAAVIVFVVIAVAAAFTKIASRIAFLEVAGAVCIPVGNKVPLKPPRTRSLHMASHRLSARIPVSSDGIPLMEYPLIAENAERLVTEIHTCE